MAEKRSAKPATREIATVALDPMVSAFQSMLEPTDEVLRSRGTKGFDSYDEIRRDPHAFSVLQKRSLEVVSREWAVIAASDRRIDKRAAELVENQLKGLNFDRLTRGLLGAVLKGFSVGEILWENRSGEWWAAKVKVKKQRRFRFTVDGELRMMTREAGFEGISLPNRKFIVHRHSIDDDDDDPYGVGLGSVLYWPGWFKRQVLANWLRGTERFAAPTVWAQYAGEYNKEREEQTLAGIRMMANDAGIATPDTVKLDLLQAEQSGGGDILEALSRYLDELMSEAVLGETLSTNSGERGARSLGEVHNEVRIAIAKADADLVCDTINRSLVKWIVDVNMPGAGYPEVWRDFEEPEDLDAKVERDQKLHEMGYEPEDPDYVSETYGGSWGKAKVQDAKEPEAPVPAARKNLASAEPGQEASFAERAEGRLAAADEIAGQLETLADPMIDAMIEAIRTEFRDARDYDDLSLRLARLSSQLGVDDLAGLVEQATTLAALEGHDSVST